MTFIYQMLDKSHTYSVLIELINSPKSRQLYHAMWDTHSNSILKAKTKRESSYCGTLIIILTRDNCVSNI